MQVFIIGSPYETAMAMAGDTRRYNKQIIECQQILDALNGKKAWRNHPCTLQYKDYQYWLLLYLNCLVSYQSGEFNFAKRVSEWVDAERPSFHTEEFFDQMKRRLYTKNPEHYAQWAYLGTSKINWYFVDGEWRYYKNGKRVNERQD